MSYVNDSHTTSLTVQQGSPKSPLLNPKLYQPIKPYQTRLIRLHKTDEPTSPLTCDLLVADILHPSFEGLGVRTSDPNSECLAPYTALSYTWGPKEPARSIACNGAQLNLTPNLHAALHSLRSSPYMPEYLWADAICIDQSNDEEKSQQVWHMLEIYKKASDVIGWLGPEPADPKLRQVLSVWVTRGVDKLVFSQDANSMILLLDYLNSREYFQRLWIQQEVYAARKFTLRLGEFAFDWDADGFSDLHLLHSLVGVDQNRSRTDRISRMCRVFDNKRPDFTSLLHALQNLKSRQGSKLECFQYFLNSKSKPNFVECLFQTSGLRATDYRDYVYGLVGMCEVPAEPELFSTWVNSRRHKRFIPVDYSEENTLNNILCAITWLLLMKYGLNVIDFFKGYSQNGQENDPALPSWVIDWKLAAKHVSTESLRKFLITSGHKASHNLSSDGDTKAYNEFQRDNSDPGLPPSNLVVRGQVDDRFYAQGRAIYSRGLLHTKYWKLNVDVESTDIMVHSTTAVTYQFPVQGGGGIRIPSSFGWLVLRPVGLERYTLIAILSPSSLCWSNSDYQILVAPEKHFVKESKSKADQVRAFHIV